MKREINCSRQDEITVVIRVMRLLRNFCHHKAEKLTTQNEGSYVNGQAAAFDMMEHYFNEFICKNNLDGKIDIDLARLERELKKIY